MGKTSFVLAGIAGLAISGPGIASSGTAVPLRAAVVIADLDLANASGVRTLQQRIHSAARRVCAPLAGRSLHDKQVFSACMERAVEEALAQVDRQTQARSDVCSVTRRTDDVRGLASRE
jgi:UrcA family protein